jgi:predicted negative regulator of RcsB-dependent stress response
MSEKTSNEAIKQTSNTSSNQIVIVVLVIIAIAAVTGVMVHRNDTSSSNRALMSTEAMQKVAVHKAASAAAMKQAETDKMAAHTAMMNDASASTGSSTMAQ